MERRYRRPIGLMREKTRFGKTVYYFRKGHGSRVRLVGDYGSTEFWKNYGLAAAGSTIPDDLPRKMFVKRQKRGEIALCVHRSLGAAKHRAKKRGMAFSLTEEWVLEQMERQGFKCALTGIPFLADEVGYRVRAFAPSLDRIDNAFGYTPDNVRIVVFAVNAMLLDWGEEVLHRVANGYRRVQNAESKEMA